MHILSECWRTKDFILWMPFWFDAKSQYYLATAKVLNKWIKFEYYSVTAHTRITWMHLEILIKCINIEAMCGSQSLIHGPSSRQLVRYFSSLATPTEWFVSVMRSLHKAQFIIANCGLSAMLWVKVKYSYRNCLRKNDSICDQNHIINRWWKSEP